MCCFQRDWFCFNDSEERDDAEWKHNKEWEQDGISDADGDDDEQYKEGNDGTFFARVSEKVKDVSLNFFDVLPTSPYNVTKRQTDFRIFLQKYFRSLSTKQNTIRPTNRAAFSTIATRASVFK